MVVFVLPQLSEIFEVKVRSPNFILFLLIKWAIFKDFWFWPQIFLKVVVTQKQPICHFKPLIWGFQILGGLGFSKLFSIIFSCFKNTILLYVYYMGYAIIWNTLYLKPKICIDNIIVQSAAIFSHPALGSWKTWSVVCCHPNLPGSFLRCLLTFFCQF